MQNTPNNVISVVIPAYNEEKTIGSVIEETLQVMDSLGLPYEIIVVDDGSTDGTKEIASKYKARVLSNGRNQGKGYALRKGFQHARGEIVVTIDADGSHKPKEIPDLLYPLFNGADIVAGSRFLGKGEDYTSKLHMLGNHLINMTIMLLTRKLITDSQTGLRAFKRKLLEKVNLESYGYEIETEITVKGLKNGFKFQEIPISCQKREHSVSRLRILSDGFKILKTILTSVAKNNNGDS
ncbi:MAG: glycosyltransferase family 2 protein [Candidatus Bathyarchaeia archaeon]